MDSSVSEPARQAIDVIINGEEITAASLAGLSNLNRSELLLLKKALLMLDDTQRISLVSRLAEIAEDNIEYNFDRIFRYFLKDTNEDVRYLAVEGLWENEETSLIDPLIELLENDSSDKVQSAAALALGKFAVMAELNKLRPEIADKIREALLGAVDDRNKSVEVSRRVLESAASLSLPDVREAITEAYNNGNAELKISALYAMGKSCDASWIPVLIKELDNDEPDVRYEAACACGELENEVAVPALIPLVDDKDTEVRLAAIQALGKIGSPTAKDRIRECLQSSNTSVREAASEALGFSSVSDDPPVFGS